MSHNYTASPVELTPYPIPDDGDNVDAASVNPAFEALGDAILYGSGVPGIAAVGGRLTLSSFLPIPSLDVASGSTLYWTPYSGGMIAIWDGTAWRTRLSDEVSLALSGMTSGKNYDVYAYWTGSALALELGPAWSTDTARSDSFFRQDGVYLRGTNHTRRYVGTIRATGATTTQDSKAKRFVWNHYNRVPRKLYAAGADTTWTYNATTIRQANSNTANKVEFVVGDYSPSEGAIEAPWGYSSTQTVYEPGIGLDTTTFFSGVNAVARPSSTSEILIAHSYYEEVQSYGYHYLSWNERVLSADAVTVYGGPSGGHLHGKVWG
jgi:hypothetical protein